MEIIKFLENNQFIQYFDIINFKDFEIGYYFKIKVVFIDESELLINEYIDTNERNYSYHWQDKYTELIKRWDNAPHFKKIITFPHHVHFQNTVLLNYSIGFTEIFKEISVEFSKHKI